MRNVNTHHIPNTVLLFILTAPFTVVFYASYVFNPIHAGNIYLYIFQMLADIIAITTLTTLWLTILLDFIQPEFHKRKFNYHDDWIKSTKPTVDILIPVANEPFDIVSQTIENAVNIDYAHKTYVLDDGGSDAIKKLCEKLDIFYIRRPNEMKGYAKSGNLNHGLGYCKGEYFAVFDADHTPKKEFLVELLPLFENQHVALVQTPQHYKNTHNFIASGTAQAQEIFYKYVQPAKNSYNASFCVGTNMIYKRSAIDEVGGIALKDHSEDIWTTIQLHEKGYESIFYNKVLAEGRAPETIPSFFRQQNRWAQGGFSLFFTHNPLMSTDLTIDQKFQYFFSNIHYFSGFAILTYLLIPIIYLLFGIHPMNIADSNGWLLHYVPYFLTVYFLPLILLGEFRLSTISVSLASFFPYLQGFFAVVAKNNYKWVATESKKSSFTVIMSFIWPHVFIICLSFLSLIVGWYNQTDPITSIICMFWVLVNTYLLGIFIHRGLLGNTRVAKGATHHNKSFQLGGALA